MERFEDPQLSDDENDPNPGHLTQEQTEALFGGGVLEKKKDHKAGFYIGGCIGLYNTPRLLVL